jgi:hypothetical protein
MSHLRKTHNRFIRYFGLIVISVFGILSTLGTGGGGGDDGGVPPVTYTGLTTPAAITSDNALLFGELAFMGLVASTSVDIVPAVQTTPQEEDRSASIVTITRILHAVINDIGINSALSSLPVGWLETINEPGLCGGNVSGSAEFNETAPYEFSGNLVFNDYCFLDIYMDGTVAVSGTCDPVTFDPTSQFCEPVTFTMTFTTFNTRGYGESETMTGTLSEITTASGYQTTLNLLIRDDNINKTYWFENYVIGVTQYSPPGFDTVRVTGNVYHPDYGYVVVSTPTPVQFWTDSLDTPPQSGVALLTGANGTAAGPTTATFTFFDTLTFTVDVDTDGDGGADVTWSCDWDGNCSMI